MKLGDFYRYETERLTLELVEIKDLNNSTEIVFKNASNENDFYSWDKKQLQELINDGEIKLI